MKIAVMGAGKMGGWLAEKLCSGNEVAVYDRTPAKAQKVPGAKALAALAEMKEFSPELFINAVSLQNTLAAFGEALVHLPEGCTICDVASVKTGLAEFYAGCGRKFASVHPMFGPTFADMESLREEHAVIIAESDGRTAEFFEKFFAGLGVQTHRLGFAEHDRTMAYSLTTPFVSSLVFASCVEKAAVPGATFARHMKIARGLLSEDDELLCEVLFNPASVPQLNRITAKLEHLKHIINARDSEEAREFLEKLRKRVG